MFITMWGFMLYPPIQDLVFIGYYAFYDFGSSVGIYVEDHENGWTYFAAIQAVLAVLTILYYIYLVIARYVLDFPVFTDWVNIGIFYGVNSLYLLLPVVKYSMIWYESEL